MEEPFLINPAKKRRRRRNPTGLMTVMNPANIKRTKTKLSKAQKKIIVNIGYLFEVFLEAGLDHTDSEDQTRRVVKQLLDHFFR